MNYINSLYTSGYIRSWWHYLPGSMYFVHTHMNANQIYNMLITHMPGRHFIVMRVDPTEKQGWLPRDAWDWFNNQ